MINKYINNLKEFVGNDFSYTLNGGVLRIREDCETSYEYDMNQKKIYRLDRGSSLEIQRFDDDKLLRLEFAIILSGVFEKTMNYDIPDIFAEKNNLQEVKEVSKEYLDEKYYSIGSIEDNKISLILDQNYKIIFRYKGVNYIIEDNFDREYIFRNFYWQVFDLCSFEYDIKRYMDIFDETFTKDELVRFWGYPIGIR